jgi:hypothetical protein
MANKDSLQEPQPSIQQILEAETNNLLELARIAGLDIATDFADADLSGVDLSGADLSGADLSGADLSGANLSDANLSGVNLTLAKLSDADLSGANLTFAKLSGADLSDADLSGANLSETDLSDADLRRANLSKTNLSHADLRRAKLSLADLRGAMLSLAKLSLLPQFTFLGNLEIFEIYKYYDKPCVFSCRNMAEHIFLALWVEEKLDCDRWLYAPISLLRLAYLKSGGIDIRSAFSNAEDNFVFDVEVFYDNIPSNIEMIACPNLTDDLLPVEGEFLNYDSPTITPKKAEASRTAIQIKREVLNLTFNFPTLHRTEAPIANLGIILQ